MTRVVVWITEGTWAGCVAAAAELAPADADMVLLHVTDADVTEAMQGALGGLLGRGTHHQDPTRTGRQLLNDAATMLGRPATTEQRSGAVGHEVVAACRNADLLICARDGAHDRLGPRSLGRHTRFVVDHAPCAVLLVWPDRTPSLDSIPPPGPNPSDRDVRHR